MKIYANFRIWYVLDTPISFIYAVEWPAPLSGPLMSLRPARDMSLRRWLVVACFSSVKNHNVSGPHLFPSFTTCQKNPFATPMTFLQRAKKSLCNRSQFRTLFLPHRFIKIRPFHQRPVSIEFLTICRIPEFPKSEQNRKSCGNVRIWRKRAAVRRKNHSNLNKSFGMNMLNNRQISPKRNCSTLAIPWCFYKISRAFDGFSTSIIWQKYHHPELKHRPIFRLVSKLKARSSKVSFHWNVAKETFELWALSFRKCHPQLDWL